MVKYKTTPVTLSITHKSQKGFYLAHSEPNVIHTEAPVELNAVPNGQSPWLVKTGPIQVLHIVFYQISRLVKTEFYPAILPRPASGLLLPMAYFWSFRTPPKFKGTNALKLHVNPTRIGQLNRKDIHIWSNENVRCGSEAALFTCMKLCPLSGQ